MKDAVVTFLGLIMVAYVLFLGFITIAFLPLAGGFFHGRVGAYYVSLILIATAAVVFSFFEKRVMAGILAVLLLLIVVFYWWFAGYGGPWGRSIFFWNVLPAVVFAVCGVASWALRRSASNQAEAGESALNCSHKADLLL